MLGNQGICMCVGINDDMFSNLHPLTKNYLRKRCGEEIKQIFGSNYKYEKSRVKLFGFKTPNEYKKEIARINGFKTLWKMEKASILKRFKSIKKCFDERARKSGFKDYKDYQEFLAKNWGFKNLSDYKKFKYKKLKKERKENNLCGRCGNERDNKFKLCLKCRKYFRK